MIITINIRDEVYETLKENLKDFNLECYNMVCETITMNQFIDFLIRQANAEYLKSKITN